MHTKFKENTMDYDIAAVEMSKKIDWFKHPHIRPICLPSRKLKKLKEGDRFPPQVNPINAGCDLYPLFSPKAVMKVCQFPIFHSTLLI